MKKTLTALLCAAMVASLTACGGQDSGSAPAAAAQTETTAEAVKLDPKEVYAEAMKKNAELTSMDLVLDMGMDMKFGEESMNMSMEMAMKADSFDSEDIKCLITNTTKAEGESIEMTMFYTDGYYYMDAMGQKIKYAMAPEDMAEQADASGAGMEVDAEWLSDITLEEQGTDKLIKFTGDPTKMASYVEDVLANAGSGMEGMEMTVKSVTGECLIDENGYYKSEKLVMDIEFSMEGQTASMTLDMTMTYNNPGQPVTIELPSTDGYTEVDASMIAG